MNWDDIIGRNRERLLLAIAPLLAVLGFDQRRREEVPRHFHSFLISLLRPAESAVRRLIIIAAIGIVVKLRLGAARAFPAGLAQKLKRALEEEEERFPAFPLIDPLKRFAPLDFGWAEEWSESWGKEQVAAAHFGSRPLRPGVSAGHPRSEPGRPHRHPFPAAPHPLAERRARQSSPPCQAAGAVEGEE